MHSVLGTEVANLPPALENYYKQYFTNRQAIVNYANQYEGVIYSNSKHVREPDDQQLSNLAATNKLLMKQTLTRPKSTNSGSVAQLNQLKALGRY